MIRPVSDLAPVPIYSVISEVVGIESIVYPINYTHLKGAAHSNPATYGAGEQLVFTAPEEVPGYTFVWWEPAMITADMTGTQTVRAVWEAEPRDEISISDISVLRFPRQNFALHLKKVGGVTCAGRRNMR